MSAFAADHVSAGVRGRSESVLLEGIWLHLPCSVALDPDLDTTKYHLFSAAEINAQLNNVTILDREQPRLGIGLAESDMIQERAGRAGDVLDLPLPVHEAKFTVFATDDFGFEADGGV